MAPHERLAGCAGASGALARHALDVRKLLGDRTKGVGVIATQGHGQRRAGKKQEQLHVGQRGDRREAFCNLCARSGKKAWRLRHGMSPASPVVNE